MKNESHSTETATYNIGWILSASCPKCGKGSIVDGVFSMKSSCDVCGQNLSPESGYYLGAMMVGFLVNAVLLIPPIILLKLFKFSDEWVIGFPFLQFFVTLPLILFYARVIWAHLGYKAIKKLG